MKNLLIVLIGCIALSCNPAKETPQLVGAYRALSVSLKGSDLDTTMVTQQLKIFTPDYMMYADFVASDSVGAFGVGTYSAEPGIIKENVIYTSADTTVDVTSRNYTLEIEQTETGYKQVIQEIGDSIKYQLTEVYERVSTEQVCPLDGAWQLTSFTVVSNNDTTKLEVTAYKVYYAGNFMFGNTYRDSTNVQHTGMGYGAFEYVSDTQIKESVKTSTFKEIAGKTFDLAIAMNGPDEFTQTITSEDGQINIEVYRRLKK